jgi:hypothetical protein
MEMSFYPRCIKVSGAAGRSTCGELYAWGGVRQTAKFWVTKRSRFARLEPHTPGNPKSLGDLQSGPKSARCAMQVSTFGEKSGVATFGKTE